MNLIDVLSEKDITQIGEMLSRQLDRAKNLIGELGDDFTIEIDCPVRIRFVRKPGLPIA